MKTSNTAQQMLKILFSVGLFCAVVYLLLDSTILNVLEGENLDGSNSLTWRSGVAAAALLLICLGFSFWAFRRHLALTIFLSVASSVVCWYLLTGSKFGFEWEPHREGGTSPLTWRSDLVILGNLAFWVSLYFIVRKVAMARRRRVAS